MCRKVILSFLVVACSISLSLAAKAGGSISLEDVVTRLAGQSPKLMAEVHTELAQSGKTIDDIVCGGTRLGRHWKHLGGLRIPSFDCQINNKSLMIDGAVHFYDAAGNEGAGPATAMYVSLSAVKWAWK